MIILRQLSAHSFQGGVRLLLEEGYVEMDEFKIKSEECEAVFYIHLFYSMRITI